MPASRAASARVMPSSAPAIACMRAAAAQSFSRRASRRSSAAGTSSRIGRPFAPIASAPAGLDTTRIMPPRVASTHNRVSHKAGWYQQAQSDQQPTDGLEGDHHPSQRQRRLYPAPRQATGGESLDAGGPFRPAVRDEEAAGDDAQQQVAERLNARIEPSVQRREGGPHHYCTRMLRARTKSRHLSLSAWK